MIDEAPATPDTPTFPTSDTPDVPWQKRYEDLRPEFDRTTQRLRDAESVWNDEQAVLTRLAERFPHLLVDEDDDTTPEPEYELNDAPPRDPRFDEIAPTVQQLAAWQADQVYAADLKDVAGDRELSAMAKRTIKHLTNEGGNNRQALEKAVKDWIEYEDAQKPAERKPAPTPAPAGKAAEQDYNASKDPEERRRARRARIAAQVEAGLTQQ